MHFPKPKKLNRENRCKTNRIYLKAGPTGPKLLKAGPTNLKLPRKYNATKQAKLEAQYGPNKPSVAQTGIKENN